MKRIVDQAIVLRRVNYGESDRVVTLLTQNHGKISVFAKSCRKQKSKVSGGIELLCASEVTFIEGKSDLKTLTSANLQHYFDGIVQSAPKTKQVFEALKRIEKLTDDGAGQEYFIPLKNYMERLAREDYEPELIDVWFSLRLLHLSGALGLIDVKSNQEKTMDCYRFNYDEHTFESHEQGEFSKNDIKLLRLLSTSNAPLRLQTPIGTESMLRNFTNNLFSTNLA